MRRKPARSDDVLAPWIYHLHMSVPDDEARTFNGAKGRGVGGRPVYIHEIMEVFDALPKVVREALAAANHPWAPHWAMLAGNNYARRSSRTSPGDVVERMKRADREEALRREMQLLKGQG